MSPPLGQVGNAPGRDINVVDAPLLDHEGLADDALSAQERTRLLDGLLVIRVLHGLMTFTHDGLHTSRE